MNILLITNYYPPSQKGWGYMQLCEEVADGLSALGHNIVVLTSTDGESNQPNHLYPVFRDLTIDPDWASTKPAALQFFVGRRNREIEAVETLEKIVDDFLPEIIFIWHAIGLPRVLLQTAERLRPTVYYLAGYLPELPDEYLAYWKAEPASALARLFKRPISKPALAQLRHEGKPIRLKYEHVICVSDYVRQRLIRCNLIPADSVVIYNGVNIDEFSSKRTTPRFGEDKPVKCLIAGRVVPDKGVHTAIDAFKILKNFRSDIELTILGDGPSDYMNTLYERVQAYGLQNAVRFRSAVPREDLPKIMDQYDVLLLPSEYAEPIARSMQEGMAMGLLVIGTNTGGSGELLIHEQTGLVHEAGNAQSLANQLVCTLQDPKYARILAEQGKEVVRSNFTIQHTVDRIEQYLRRSRTQEFGGMKPFAI